MVSFDHSRSTDDRLAGCALDEALTIACPAAENVLRASEDDDPIAVLRAAGFQVTRVPADDAGVLRFVRSAVAALGERWVAIEIRRGFANVRDRRRVVRVALKELFAFVDGLFIAVEPPPEQESIVAVLMDRAADERGTIVSAVSATILGPLLALFPAAALMFVFNDVIPNSLNQSLLLVVAALVGMALFQAWVSIIRLETLLYVRARMETGIGKRLLARVLRLPFWFLQKYTPSSLIEVFRGLGSARDLVSERVLAAGFDGAMSILILAVVFMVSPLMSFVLAGCAAAYLLVATGIAWLQMRGERAELRARTVTRDRLIDGVRTIATVKAAGAEDVVLERWGDALVTELRAGQRRQRLVLYSAAVRDGMRQLTIFAALVAGALLITGSTGRLGSYVALLQLTGTFAAGILSLGTLIQNVFMAAPYVRQGQELSNIAPVPRVRRSPRPVRIQIDDVWFRYDDDSPWVVRGFNAVLEPGKQYRFEGASGSGKTTLLRLVAAIYTPNRGRIHVNGVDLQHGGSSFLYIPQNVTLFEGSLLDNLRILSGGATSERLLAAAEEIGLAPWVATLPMGYATLLMSGTAVSGGQKQLIALTAAAASDVSLLLLDETGSNLDAATYRRVFSSKVWQGRTLVYVGHAAYAHLPGSQVLPVASAGSS